MKYLLIIGDGMADEPIAELGGCTPLEYAEKPMMDKLSGAGILGRVRNCPEGLAPGSDTAMLTIFGCDPRKYFFGRAPLEAAAQGIQIARGDLALRCNMVTIEEGEDKAFRERRIISHSAGSIEGRESQELVRALFREPMYRVFAEDAGLEVIPAQSYRHIAVQSGGDGRGLVLVPPHDHLGELVGDNLPCGNRNAEVLAALMELSNVVLSRHPINEERRKAGKLAANCIWLWAQGTAAELPSFWERYGKKGGVISAVPLCHGIGILQGLEKIEVEGATGELDTNYEGKAEAAIKALEGGADFICVHVEAPDECTHNGDLRGKLAAIENIDKRTLRPLSEGLAERGIDYRMLVLSDHRTLSRNGAHDAGEVPFILYDSRSKNGGSGLEYTEKAAEKGVELENGLELMDLLFETGAAKGVEEVL